MAVRLSDFASNIRVPEPSADEGVLFTPDLLPEIPRELEAPDLAAREGIHYYGRDFSLPLIEILGSKPAMRGLGVLLLSHVFRGPCDPTRVFIATIDEGGRPLPEIRVDVSDLRPDGELPPSGLQLRATAFRYWPYQREKHPWWREPGGTEPRSLPQVNLGDENGDGPLRPDNAAIVYGFGSLEGTVRLAELLLDISCEENARNEFDLEGEPGFRGVGPASAELRLCLPGNDIYEILFRSQSDS